jgi:hypothetical protein
MTLQQPTDDAIPLFCEQFTAFLEIETYISFKEGGDERREGASQILQVDLASTVLVPIFKPLQGHSAEERKTNQSPTVPGNASRRSYICFPRTESRLVVRSQTFPFFFLCRRSRNWALFGRACPTALLSTNLLLTVLASSKCKYLSLVRV